MLRLLTVKVAVIGLVLFTIVPRAEAGWGDFDTGFGFQGAAIDMITGYHPRSVAVQADGKILVTGYRTVSHSGDRFFLRRYMANGQLDTAFGTNGAAIGPETNTITTDYRGDSIVIQANGKIAVAGWANGRYAVWQFLSSGTADKTFGDYGLQLTSYGVIDGGYPELDIQSGKLLVTLRKYVQSDLRVALVRLTSSGARDSQFGNAGESVTGLDGAHQRAESTIVEPDGKITVGGAIEPNLHGLQRLLANGQNDQTFTPPATYLYGILGPGLVKMVNGKYAMRWFNLAGNGSLTLVLEGFNAAGIPDSSVTPFNAYPVNGCPEVFTSQNDGKLIVQFAAMYFRTNADLDASSIEYRYCSNLNGINDFGRAAIQTDDKMVAAGVYNNYLMLVRTLPD